MRSPPAQACARAGFRALDLAGLLMLLALAAGVVVPAFEHHGAVRRDSERLERLQHIHDGIERHWLDRGAFPAGDGLADGWDVSHDGDFLPVLVELGYLEQALRDPLESERFHFVYRHSPAGSCACAREGGFYVLGIRRFETEWFAARRPGGVPCPHRDWPRDLAHVTGGGLRGG